MPGYGPWLWYRTTDNQIRTPQDAVSRLTGAPAAAGNPGCMELTWRSGRRRNRFLDSRFACLPDLNLTKFLETAKPYPFASLVMTLRTEQKTPCLGTARTHAILTAPAAGWFSNVR
jgi:hypothetical protein